MNRFPSLGDLSLKVALSLAASLAINLFFASSTLAAPSILDQLQSSAQLDHRLIEKLKSTPSPQLFVKSETFDWPSALPPEQILYGNDEIGFFSTKNFRLLKNKVEVTFIPPTYQKPLRFWTLTKSKKKSLGTRAFRNPLQEFFPPATVAVLNRPTFPFIMLNGTTSAIPLVINRLGEIVWLRYIPVSKEEKEGNENFKTTAMTVLDHGEFIFLRQDELTRLIRTDSFGKTKYDIDFKTRNLNFPSSHTVQYLPEANEVLFLSYDCRELPRTQEFAPLFKGPGGWLRLFTLPRRSYRGGKLIRLALDGLKPTEVWNSFQNFSPNKNPSLATSFMTDADFFMDVRTSADYEKRLQYRNPFSWYGWPERYCDVDWTHENSAQYVKGKGYLLSLRNLNKIIFLNENGELAWSLGMDDQDTYQLSSREGFSLQHSAVYLPDGSILVYDNHTSYRGFTGLRLGNRILRFKLDKPGPVHAEWSFVLPTAHSDVRGSVSVLPNKNIFAYTAGNPGSPCQIFEINPDQNKIVGDVRYNFYHGNKGFEAKPLLSFGGDTYIESEHETKPEPASAAPPKTEDFLQFSY